MNRHEYILNNFYLRDGALFKKDGTRVVVENVAVPKGSPYKRERIAFELLYQQDTLNQSVVVLDANYKYFRKENLNLREEVLKHRHSTDVNTSFCLDSENRVCNLATGRRVAFIRDGSYYVYFRAGLEEEVKIIRELKGLPPVVDNTAAESKSLFNLPTKNVKIEDIIKVAKTIPTLREQYESDKRRFWCDRLEYIDGRLYKKNTFVEVGSPPEFKVDVVGLGEFKTERIIFEMFYNRTPSVIAWRNGDTSNNHIGNLEDPVVQKEIRVQRDAADQLENEINKLKEYRKAAYAELDVLAKRKTILSQEVDLEAHKKSVLLSEIENLKVAFKKQEKEYKALNVSKQAESSKEVNKEDKASVLFDHLYAVLNSKEVNTFKEVYIKLRNDSSTN